MPNNPRQYGRARTGSAAGAGVMGRRPSPIDGLVNVGPALDCSFVTKLFGRPYPVQFRNQGALDTWERVLGTPRSGAAGRSPARFAGRSGRNSCATWEACIPCLRQPGS